MLQERRDAGSLAAATLAAEVAVLEAAVDRLVAGERTHLFTFLRVPGVPATNWRASRPSADLAIPGTDRHPTPSTRPDPLEALDHACVRTEAVTT